MLKSVKNFFDFLLDFFLPRRADFAIVSSLTPAEFARMPRAAPLEDMHWITALFPYKDRRMKALIWELKYRGTVGPALDYVGSLLFEEILALVSDIQMFDTDARILLIPVPLSPQRRHERGYNQSEYIARTIVAADSQHILLYAPQWLSKIKETPHQSRSASRRERMKNLTGCFQAKPDVAGTYVVLIDDVVTTGSTLAEARTTLLAAGARDVHAFTIAH